MAYTVLLTGSALIAAGFAFYFAWRAGLSAEKAEHSEHRLAIMRGQVRGLEVSLTALDESHRKLAGKVHADAYWRGQREEQPLLSPAAQVYAGDEPLGACENWAIAQREGPTSAAARCECVYCATRRNDRANRRASMRSGVKS